MTQIDTELLSIQVGNGGAMPAGAIVATHENPPKGGTPNANGEGPPLQVIVGAQKPAELYAYIRGMTPDNLSYHLEAFSRGSIRGIIPVWRKMRERDGHLLAVSEKRLGRVAALEWKIVPKEDSPAAKAQAEYLKAFIEAIPEFENRIELLVEAIEFGVAGCEIEWLPAGGPDGKLGARLWPLNSEDLDLTGKGVKLFVGASGQAMELPADKFLIHRLKVSLMVASSILFVMKLITAGQWLAFGEKFGMPGIQGTAPTSASDADMAKFFDMLVNWAQEMVVVNKEGYTVTPLTMSGANGPLTYPQLIEWADRENSKIWTGHTVTSEGQSGTGTLAGGAAQDQLDDLVMADGKRLAASIEKFLCEPAIRFQFGQGLLCNFQLVGEKPMTPADKKVEAETDALLINDVGLKLPLTDLHEKYGWRQPEDGEEVAEGRKTSPQISQIPQIDDADGNPINPPAGGMTNNPPKGGTPNATAMKAGGMTEDELAGLRREMVGMMRPLESLVARMGTMSEEEFAAELAKIEMPDEGVAGQMAQILVRGIQAGRAKAKVNAGGKR